MELRYAHTGSVPDKVYCYNQNTGLFLGEAFRKEPVHMAKANQSSQDLKMIHSFHSRKKQIKQYLQAELAEFNDSAFSSDPSLALLNPISFTKNEVKKAEDNLVLQLVPMSSVIKGKPAHKLRVINTAVGNPESISMQTMCLQELSKPKARSK